ncbi:UNVERIFIED_CONTAM: hypothetical protein K2H54_002449 [Gekko kuhli]
MTHWEEATRRGQPHRSPPSPRNEGPVVHQKQAGRGYSPLQERTRPEGLKPDDSPSAVPEMATGGQTLVGVQWHDTEMLCGQKSENASKVPQQPEAPEDQEKGAIMVELA